MRGTLFGTQPTVNVFWLNLTHTGAASQTDLNTLLAAIAADFATDVTGELSDSFEVVGWDATWITGVGTALQSTVTRTDTGAGSTAAPENAATSWVVNWLIGRYYRGGHPRTYLAGISSSNITNGSNVVAANAATLAAFCTTWMGHVNAYTTGLITVVSLGTVSFAEGNAWRSPPVFVPYTGVKIRNRIGTQKRRIGGR